MLRRPLAGLSAWSACVEERQRGRILQVVYDDRRNGQHKAADDLFALVAGACVREIDARTEQSHPGAELNLEHQSEHREDHAQHVQVLRCGAIVIAVYLQVGRIVSGVG